MSVRNWLYWTVPLSPFRAFLIDMSLDSFDSLFGVTDIPFTSTKFEDIALSETSHDSGWCCEP